jgi:hypothetical protein
LRRQAEQRALLASKEDVKSLFELPPLVADRCITLYLASKNFAEANDWSTQMHVYAGDFSADQQRRILEGISKNGQLLNSKTVGSVIAKLRQTGKLSADEFESVLQHNGLRIFMRDPGEPAF